MSTILSLDWPEPAACEEVSGVYRHPFHEREGTDDEYIEDRPVPVRTDGVIGNSIRSNYAGVG